MGQVVEVSDDPDDEEPYRVVSADGKKWWYE
eukprot:SAG11_NODE_17871_length_506_cov_7.201474_1_plen_30_part_10